VQVPAAEWDGVPFYESRAISRIVAEAYKDAATLIPTDLKKKAVFEQWASLEANTFDPQLGSIVYEVCFKQYKGEVTDPAAVDAALTKVTPGLVVLNEQLGHHDYITGQFSLVDIFLTPNWQWLQNTAVGKDILAKYPNIAAWWHRVSSRPAWQKVLAEKN
jgi:glutathione S-transferase